MFSALYSITKNTFTETLRQPIYAVILVCALILFILAPSISMYTLDEDVKLLRELGLSTLFLTGLFIAVFSATGTITEEIESKTITTILSKPVPRPIFVIGKFFGISLAVILAHYLGTVAYLLTARHGVMERASDTMDVPVIVSVIVVLSLTFLISSFLNYTYDWNLQASAIVTAFILSTFALLFLTFVDREWRFGLLLGQFNVFDIYASLLLLMGILILVALAVFFSTRMNVVLTLTCCIIVFLFGLISDWIFGRFAIQKVSSPLHIFIIALLIAFSIFLCFMYVRLYLRYIRYFLPKFFFTRLGAVLRIIFFWIVPIIFFVIGNFFIWRYWIPTQYYQDFFTFWAKIASVLLPNMQVFWVSDAIYETGKIPVSYLWQGLCYCASYTIAILSLAVAFFQRRQVG